MIILDRPDFLNLPAGLRGAFNDRSAASFFDLPQWFDLVARHASPAQSFSRVYADDLQRCVLVASVDLARRQLISCASPYTCDYSLIPDCPSPAAEIETELAHDIARKRERFRSLRLTGLDPLAPGFAGILNGFRRAGLIARPYFSWAIWHDNFHRVTFADYLARIPAVLRNTWRRKLNLLERYAPPDWRFYGPNMQELDEFISAYDSVYAQSWKKPEPYPHFMPALIRMAGTIGALRGGVLWARGEPVAAQVWLVWRGRATIFKLAHAEKWSAYSPGTLLTMEMMRHVLAADAPYEITFGRGDDRYKRLWLRARRERWGIEAESFRGAASILRGIRIAGAIIRDATPFKRRPQLTATFRRERA